MLQPTIRKITLACIITILLTPLLAINGDWIWSQPKDGAMRLQAPPFFNSAQAQTNSLFDQEAGIAAYFNAGGNINLNNAGLRSLYRTFDAQTSEYLLGSVRISDPDNNDFDYSENDDAKLYVSAEGWVMAYYSRSEPTSKIFDWLNWDGNSNLPTKLGQVLGDAAARIGASQPTPTYYHFRFPNANRMMLIADNYTAGNVATNSFNFTPPSGFEYSEWSWSLASLRNLTYDHSYELNGSLIAQVDFGEIVYGTFSSTQITLGNENTVTIRADRSGDRGASGLAVIYKVP